MHKPRVAEVELSKGGTNAAVARKLGITDQTYYPWRRGYAGLKVDQAKRLKDSETENARFKRLVADQAPDNAILRKAAKGHF